MTDPSILEIAGERLAAERSGALFWPARRLLVVADLHLGKALTYARAGALLPPYDAAETLGRLADDIARRDPEMVVCLGDSFHDRAAAASPEPEVTARLAALAAGRDWVWIAGNHDPLPPALPVGRATAELALAGLVFRHEARTKPQDGEISGHFHPKASVVVRARRVGGRCFVHDRRRAVLPAYGAYAGGLSVLAPAIRRLFPDGLEVRLIGPDRLYRLPLARLTLPTEAWE